MNKHAGEMAGRVRFELAGLTAGTEAVCYILTPGEAVVIGRDKECTIVVGAQTAGAASDRLISRQHAVLEDIPGRGWCIHDNGSRNGTAILRAGRLPALVLQPGVDHRLEQDDVIELAGSDEYQFVFRQVG